MTKQTNLSCRFFPTNDFGQNQFSFLLKQINITFIKRFHAIAMDNISCCFFDKTMICKKSEYHFQQPPATPEIIIATALPKTKLFWNMSLN